MEKILIDIIVNCDESKYIYLQINGKVILFGVKIFKIINLKERKISLLDLNDLIILFSDDDDDNDRINRRESIFFQFVDLVCFFFVLFIGKVEVVLNENICRVECEL